MEFKNVPLICISNEKHKQIFSMIKGASIIIEVVMAQQLLVLKRDSKVLLLKMILLFFLICNHCNNFFLEMDTTVMF